MKTDKTDISAQLLKYQSDHEAGWNNNTAIRETWYDKERLLVGRLADNASKNKTARVTDAHLSTLAWERQMRVCSQLPSGQIYSVSKKDEKAAALENLVLSKYIQPNANSQFDLLTKFRMTGVYASVYGAQFVMYDYRIDDDYIGPDFWLVPARNITFQTGRNSVQDCSFVDITTTQNESYIDALIARDSKTWKTANLKLLKTFLKDGAAPSSDNNDQKKSAVEMSRNPKAFSTSTPRIELVTRYEKGVKGHWITWALDYPEAGILRDIPNPHKSGKIPVVGRYCFPLLDSIWGLGDFERGMTMQKAKDSLINLYLEGMKLSIFAPLKIDINNVTPSTIKMEAGARWLMKDLNAVQAHQTNSMAGDDFNKTYEFMTTALQNQFGTTDTSANGSQAGNPAFGRTPAALKQLNNRELSRDAWDRYMLEKFIEELYEGMINLLGEKQEKPINFHLFDKEIEDIEEQFDEEACDKLLTKYDDRSAKITIPKSLIGGAYQFVIDPSSTKENDDDAQQESLKAILEIYMPNQQVWDAELAKDSLKFNAGMAFKQFVYGSGVKDPDNIIESTEDEGEPQLDENGQPVLDAQGQPVMGDADSQQGAPQLNPQQVQQASQMMQPQTQPQAPQQPQPQMPPQLPGQPAGQPQAMAMQPQQPSTADQTQQILDAIKAGQDPTAVMDHLSQASTVRDPQSMAAAQQILPGGK